jgi:hypothetical protein
VRVRGVKQCLQVEEISTSAAILPDGRKAVALSFRSGPEWFDFVLDVQGVEGFYELMGAAVADVCAISREAAAVRS